jgi:hypothetical protein
MSGFGCVDCRGGNITVTADGVVLLSATDPNPLGAGYLSFAGTLPAEPDPAAPAVVRVDDIVVEAPAADGARP